MANNFVHRAGGAFGVRPEGTAHAQSSVDDSDRDGRGDRSRVLERIGRRPGELRRRDPTGTGRACRAARRCTRPPRARGSSCGLARRPIASSDDGKVRLLGLAVLQRARWHTRRGRRDRASAPGSGTVDGDRHVASRPGDRGRTSVLGPVVGDRGASQRRPPRRPARAGVDRHGERSAPPSPLPGRHRSRRGTCSPTRSTDLWFVPVANPDGYDYSFSTEPLWRKNLRDNDGDGQITDADGVDLNRNLPYKWGFDNEGSSPLPGAPTYRGPSPA